MPNDGNTGGVVIRRFSRTTRFDRDFRKLTPAYQTATERQVAKMSLDPRPIGIRFEKLKGWANPEIYTIHVDLNYKVSFEIEGDLVRLRRVGNHNEIDRAP